MKILPLFVLLACVAWQACAQEDGEARPAPSRGLLKRGLLAKGKQTSTTTTAAPQEEAEYEEEGDYPAEGEAQEPSTETPPSSTEGKKLVAGGVRPFRSNTDLLEALKRRRAQAAEAKSRGSSSSDSAPAQDAASEAAKASYNKKRFNNAPAARETTNEEAPAPAPAPAKPSRGRFGRPATRSVQEPETEEHNDAAPPPRNSRTFPRRGGN